ncbi:MAG: lysophospholipid acyltransferase family protein [Pirellulaceae bacterium]
MQTKSRETTTPEINSFLLRGFRWYSFRLIRRHFHAVAMLRNAGSTLASIPDDQPLIVYGNHPGWWDPLTAQLVCATYFPQRDFFAPIDAAALQRYRVLARLGFYPIEMASTSGAANFLKCSRAILRRPNSSIWLTPEGRFCDARDRGAELMPGLAHLCGKLDVGRVLPLAMEYPFWEERQPEMLIALGAPIDVAAYADCDKSAWSRMLTDHLRATQDRLAEASISRETELFELVFRGSRGTDAVYDVARRLRSWVTRTPFQATHGGKFQ